MVKEFSLFCGFFKWMTLKLHFQLFRVQNNGFNSKNHQRALLGIERVQSIRSKCVKTCEDMHGRKSRRQSDTWLARLQMIWAWSGGSINNKNTFRYVHGPSVNIFGCLIIEMIECVDLKMNEWINLQRWRESRKNIKKVGTMCIFTGEEEGRRYNRRTRMCEFLHWKWFFLSFSFVQFANLFIDVRNSCHHVFEDGHIVSSRQIDQIITTSIVIFASVFRYLQA